MSQYLPLRKKVATKMKVDIAIPRKTAFNKPTTNAATTEAATSSSSSSSSSSDSVPVGASLLAAAAGHKFEISELRRPFLGFFKLPVTVL